MAFIQWYTFSVILVVLFTWSALIGQRWLPQRAGLDLLLPMSVLAAVGTEACLTRCCFFCQYQYAYHHLQVLVLEALKLMVPAYPYWRVARKRRGCWEDLFQLPYVMLEEKCVQNSQGKCAKLGCREFRSLHKTWELQNSDSTKIAKFL